MKVNQPITSTIRVIIGWYHKVTASRIKMSVTIRARPKAFNMVCLRDKKLGNGL